MKKNLTFILLVLALKVAGQMPSLEMSSREKIFGNDFRNHIKIKGIEHGFKDYIQQVYVDTISGLITLKILSAKDDGKWLTDDGYVAVYDPKLKKILWSIGINYQKGGVDQVNSLIIKSDLYKGRYILDLKSGKILWETKNPIYYTDSKNLIGLMYSNSKKEEMVNTLIGVDLTSGKEKWSRRLKRQDEWSETLKLSDSVVAVVSSGFHTFNLYTGAGWDYDLVTNGKGKIQGIVSNIVLNNSKIYIASKESLVCLDESGKAIWSVALPTELMSKSHLFIKNKVLYILNRGLVNPGPQQVIHGKPFFAGYGLEDGLQKFFAPIVTSDFVNGLEIRSQSISLICGNSIMKYSLKDGQFIKVQSYNINETGTLRYFAGDLRFPAGQNLYIRKTDSTFHNLLRSDTTKQFVVTTNQKAVILNDQLKIEGQIAYKDLYFHYGSSGKFKLINNAEDVYVTLVLDQKNKSLAKVEASYGAILIDKILYDWNEKKFNVIDLSGVIKN